MVVSPVAFTPPDELRCMARDWLKEPEEDNRQIRMGTILLASLLGGCGPNNKRIRAYTGVPLADLNRASFHLRRAEIWQPDGTMYYPWADDCMAGSPKAAIGFALQVLVAEGAVVRKSESDSYRHRMLGEEYGPSDVIWADFIRSTHRPVKAARRWNIPGRGELVTMPA